MFINVILTYGIVVISLIISLSYAEIKQILHNQFNKTRTSSRDERLQVCIILTYILGILITILFSYYDILVLEIKENYSALLTTAATIIATILAVSFSLSIFGV